MALAIVSLSAVGAADGVNSTDDADLTAIDESPQSNSEDDVEILKEDNTIVVTNKTFSDYFDGSGHLSNSVAEGSTLDFQGLFEVSDTIKGVYIDKSVNITSSTKDAIFMFNSTNGDLGKDYTEGRFIIDGVSKVSIENVAFNRTQVLIYDSSEVILDNIKMVSHNYNMFKDSSLTDALKTEEGILKIYNDKRIFIKNSYFYAYKTISGIIECRDIEDIVIDNNAFHSYSDRYGNANSVGRKVNLKTVANTAVMTNNVAYANCSLAGFAYLQAKEILFENNSCIYYKTTSSMYPMTVQLGQSDVKSKITVKNNSITELVIRGNAFVANNVVDRVETSGDSTILINNTVNTVIVLESSNVLLKDSKVARVTTYNSYKNITVENNVITKPVTVQSTQTIFKNNRIDAAITVKSTGVVFNNNTISGNIEVSSQVTCEITKNHIIGNIEISNKAVCEIVENSIEGKIDVFSKNSIITDNTINAPLYDYAVTIKGDKEYVNNEVSYNMIYSRLYCGDNAVKYDENYFNYIEENTPATQLAMGVNITSNAFDYGETTTVIVDLKGAEGNVTIDVDGEKYVVGLTNATASQVLTKYSLGVNNVSILYYDKLNDVWAIGHVKFTVKKVAYCPVELIYDKMFEGKVSSLNVVLPDDANGTVFVSLTNGPFTVNVEQDADGKNNIIVVPGLPLGNYTLTATFTSIKYVTNSTKVNVNVGNVPVYGLKAENVVMDYNDKTKYKVLVTEDGKALIGEAVKITLNGKTSEVKTDENGYATLTITNLPGKYTLTAACKGQSIKNTIQVKQNLKTGKVTVKKSAKSFVLKATLSKVKGKTLTFKFNGKTYTAKTDKKGVAKVTIKKNIIKKLKKGKKYTFTVKYVSNTVKSQIIVK